MFAIWNKPPPLNVPSKEAVFVILYEDVVPNLIKSPYWRGR